MILVLLLLLQWLLLLLRWLLMMMKLLCLFDGVRVQIWRCGTHAHA